MPRPSIHSGANFCSVPPECLGIACEHLLFELGCGWCFIPDFSNSVAGLLGVSNVYANHPEPVN